MAAAANWEEDDEWELINDDGFVYERKKRPRLDPCAPSSSSFAPPAQLDQELEHKNRLERKKVTILKIKERYAREILQWEHLSNTLSDARRKSSVLQRQEPQEIHGATTSSAQCSASTCPSEHSSESTCRILVDELLSQAEAQEAIIEDVAQLCDIAEAFCSEKEEQVKQLLVELPVWPSSSRELIISLCDD